MRALVALAVRRRVTVLMCALAMAAFGVVGYQRLPLDLLPDISYPSLTVQPDFPDTAPAEVENLITRPVEEAVGVLRGLRTIHSVSRPGVSEVTLEFDWGADMDLLLLDVREKLDRLILPEEAEDPVVLRYDPALDPILRIALTGSDDLTFELVGITDPAFTVTDPALPITLPPGGSQTVTVRYTAGAPGSMPGRAAKSGRPTSWNASRHAVRATA